MILSLIGVTSLIACTSEPQVPTTQPTATTVPCPTDEEQTYFDSLQGTTRSISAQIGLMGEDLQRAADNFVLLLDDIWLMGIESSIYNIGIGADKILALDAPESKTNELGMVLIDESADLMALTLKGALASLANYIDTLDDYAAVEYSIAMDDSAADVKYIHASIDRFCY